MGPALGYGMFCVYIASCAAARSRRVLLELL